MENPIPENQSRTRVLVVRPDRLGDVILSTPVFAVVKNHYPNSHLTVMVRASVAPLLRGLGSVDDVLIYDPEGRHVGIRGFFRLIREIAAKDFRIAIVLQSPWRIAAAVFLARVRYRVGPLSKLHSFIFYNRGLRQRRSQVEMHETDYNLQLLRRIGIRVGSRAVPTQVRVPEPVLDAAKAWLTSRGWETKDQLVVVHPGMGGSALNWPEAHYVDFIRRLLAENIKVLVTGGATEEGLLERIRTGLGDAAKPAFFYGGRDSGAVDFLGGLYHWSSLVVAPSTGPLHLAVALGRPVVTFYPPIRVQSAIRWGPYLKDESRASILVPEVYCGEDFKCRGNLCNYYPCMKSLLVPQALEAANRQLAAAEPGPEKS